MSQCGNCIYRYEYKGVTDSGRGLVSKRVYNVQVSNENGTITVTVHYGVKERKDFVYQPEEREKFSKEWSRVKTA